MTNPMIMTRQALCERLCRWDARNPLFAGIPRDADDPQSPPEGCCCDNCFYGRHRLASYALMLRDELETWVGELS